MHLFLVIFAVLTFANARPSKAKDCFFDGASMSYRHACGIAGLRELEPLILSIRTACRDVCEEAARKAIPINVEILKSKAALLCSQAGSCSEDMLSVVNSCLAGLAKANQLAIEIEKESREPQVCKAKGALTS